METTPCRGGAGMAERQGIAAVIGGWSVRHRAVAIIGWLVFVAIAMTLGRLAGQQQMTEDQYATGDSARVIQILDDAGLRTPAQELVLVTSEGPVTDPAPRAAVADLIGALQDKPAVTDVQDPYAAGCTIRLSGPLADEAAAHGK